jgi:hypothetical protein
MASLESVFNHLVLPPQLPDHGDQDTEALSSNILARLSTACRVFEDFSGVKQWRGEWATVWASIGGTLRMCHGIHQKGIEAKLLLQDWADFRPHDFFILRIAEQNAALLLRRTVR